MCIVHVTRMNDFSDDDSCGAMSHFCMFAMGVVYIANILYTHSQNREQQAILELKALPIHVVNGTNTDVSSCLSRLLHSLHNTGIGYVSFFVTTDLRMYTRTYVRSFGKDQPQSPLIMWLGSFAVLHSYFAMFNMYVQLGAWTAFHFMRVYIDTCYSLSYVLMPTYLHMYAVCSSRYVHHNKRVDYKFDWSSLVHCVLMWYVNTALQPVNYLTIVCGDLPVPGSRSSDGVLWWICSICSIEVSAFI